MIRPMRPEEEPKVGELAHLCHPCWKRKPAGHYFAFPTLVRRAARDRIVGSTSFYVSWPPSKDLVTSEYVMWGYDVCVHPDYRRKGMGQELCEARFRLAEDIGIRFFIGMTWPSNTAMLRIFERLGCYQSPERIAGAYPENRPPDQIGLMFTKGL